MIGIKLKRGAQSQFNFPKLIFIKRLLSDSRRVANTMFGQYLREVYRHAQYQPRSKGETYFARYLNVWPRRCGYCSTNGCQSVAEMSEQFNKPIHRLMRWRAALLLLLVKSLPVLRVRKASVNSYDGCKSCSLVSGATSSCLSVWLPVWPCGHKFCYGLCQKRCVYFAVVQFIPQFVRDYENE